MPRSLRLGEDWRPTYIIKRAASAAKLLDFGGIFE